MVLAYHLARALHLLGFCIAPSAVNPDPLLDSPAGMAALSVVVAVLALWGMVRFARYADTTSARVAAALVWIAFAAALAASLVHDGDRGPLARGVFWVAPILWAALATTASAAAGEWLGSSFKHKRTAAAVVVLGASAKLFGDAAPILQSRDRMWLEALKREPGHERAFEKVVGPMLAKGKHAEARRAADRCLAARPGSSICLDARIEAEKPAAKPP